MSIVSLIIFGDSLSYMSISPWYQMAGGFPSPVLTEILDGIVGGGALSRYAGTTYGTDPALRMANTAVSGTNLNTSSSLASARVDALIPSGYTGPKRSYLLCGFHSNQYTATPSVYAADLVTYFSARKTAAAAKGVTLACGTMTIPSRTGAGGFTEANRHTFNNTYLRDSAWRTTNGIYVADLASVTELDATNAANNATYFSDTIHMTEAGAALAVPAARAMVTQMISDLG